MISHICLNTIPWWVCRVGDPPQHGWASSSPVKSQGEQKESGNKIYICWGGPGHGSSVSRLLFPQFQTHWNSDHQLPVSRPSNYTTDCLRSPSCRSQVRNFLRCAILLRQLLIIRQPFSPMPTSCRTLTNSKNHFISPVLTLGVPSRIH